jgi:hypothetical protein
VTLLSKNISVNCASEPGRFVLNDQVGQRQGRHQKQVGVNKETIPTHARKHAWALKRKRDGAHFTGRARNARPDPCRFFSGSGADLQVLGKHR